MSGDTFDAGTVYAEVRIDRDPAQRDLKEVRAMLRDFEKSGPYNARVGVDRTGLKRDIDRAKTDLRRFAAETVKAGTGLQLAGLRRDLATAYRLLSGFDGKTVTANARLNLNRLLADVGVAEIALRALERGREVSVRIKANYANIRAELDAALRDHEVKIRAVLDDASLDEIQQQLRAVTGLHVIGVGLHGAEEIVARLELIHADLKRVSQPRWTIRVSVNATDIVKGLGLVRQYRNFLLGIPKRVISQIMIDPGRALALVKQLGSILLGTAAATGVLTGALGLLGPALALIGQLSVAAVGGLALLPGVIAGVGGAFAAIKVGTSGIGDAFKALDADAQAASTGVGSSAKKQSSAINQIQGATQSLEDAQRSQARTARQGQKSVEEAMLAQFRTVRDGARQVADAKQSLDDTIRQSNEQLQAADTRVTEVFNQNAEKMATARQRLADTIASSNARVESAEERVTSAHERLRLAQEAVTRAVRDAKEANEDLALSLRSSELSVTEAEQGLARARERLAHMPADSTALDVQEQITAVERAKLSLDEAKERYGDVKDEATAAAKAGVEGSDQVVAAKRDEASAVKDVADAEKDLATERAQRTRDIGDAEAELNKTRMEGEKDLREAIKDRAKVEAQTNRDIFDSRKALQLAQESADESNLDAAKRVAEARLQQKEANDDAQRSVTRAGESLREAMVAAGEAADGATASAKKADAALAKLSPNARAFVLTVQDLKKGWTDVKNLVQERLFQGVSDDLKLLSGAQLPGVSDGLVDIAGRVNDQARIWAKWMSEAEQVDSVRTTLHLAADATGTWTSALKPITGIFLELSKIGLPILRDIGTEFTAGADKLLKYLKTPEGHDEIERAMRLAKKAVEDLLGILGNIGGAFWDIAKAADEAGLDVLGSLESLTAKTKEWLDSPVGHTFIVDTLRSIKETVDNLKPGFEAALQVIKDLVEYISPKLPGVATDVSKIAKELAPVATDIAKKMFDSFKWAMDAIAGLPPGTLTALAYVFVTIYALKSVAFIFAPLRLLLMVFAVARVLNGLGLLGTVLKVTGTPTWLGSFITWGSKMKVPGVLSALQWLHKVIKGGIPAWLGPMTALVIALGAASEASQLIADSDYIQKVNKKDAKDRTIGEGFAKAGSDAGQKTFNSNIFSGDFWSDTAKNFSTVKHVDFYNSPIGKSWFAFTGWVSKTWTETWTDVGLHWDHFTETMGTQWDEFWGRISGSFQADFVDPITGAWDTFWQWFYVDGWQHLTMQVGDDWSAGWNRVTTSFQDDLVVPVQNAWNTFWQWFYVDGWQHLTTQVGDDWSAGWTRVTTSFQDDLVTPLQTAWGVFWKWFYTDGWLRLTEQAKTEWSNAWDEVGRRWDAFTGWLRGVWDTFYAWFWTNGWLHLAGLVKGEWSSMWDNMQIAWNNFRTNILDPIVNFITVNMPDAFRRGVEAIGKHWNGLRDMLRPVTNWLGQHVYNGVIMPVWNWVASKVGMPTLETWKAPEGFATGGQVRGPGGETGDKIPALLSDNEFVVKASVTKRVLPFLRALNGGQAEAMRAAAADKAVDPQMQRFAGGGLANAVQVARGMVGKPYVYGHADAGGADCSGLWSIITRAARGEANPYRRIGTTGNFPWDGFTQGLTSALAIGNSARKGHMAGTLGGVNYEARQSGTPILAGAAAKGADNSFFDAHYSLPYVGGLFASGGNSVAQGSAAAVPWLSEAFDKLKTLTGFGEKNGAAGQWGEIHSNAGSTMAKKAGEKALDSITNMVSPSTSPGGFSGSGGAKAKIVGAESGGSYTARNPTSSASGKYQMIDSTWRAYRGSSTAPQAWMATPAEQDAAAERYVMARYGGWDQALKFRNMHGWYDDGGMLQPGDTAATNATGKPEPVLTTDQWDAVMTLARNDIDSKTAAARVRAAGAIAGTVELDEATIERLAAAMARMAPTINLNGSHIADPEEQAEALVFALRSARRGRP